MSPDRSGRRPAGDPAAVGPPSHRPVHAFLWAVPIAGLGGLMGLGGAEFRLPVLAGPLRYPPRRAVPLNLAVSLVTVTAALATRSGTLSLLPIAPLLPAILSLTTGAVVAAFLGTALARRLSDERFASIIRALLLAIGVALIVEGLLPRATRGLLPAEVSVRILSGIAFGLGIGLVSSLLGVAGGELIIPTLLFGFGADIKAAGTASLLISLPTVLVGVLRYHRGDAYRERADLSGTVVPMSAGSVLGAVGGGFLVGLAPQEALKIGLGLILIASALRVFGRAGHGGR